MMRILSWILSLLLHACVVLAGLFLATPGEMRVDLSVPVYQVELVRLSPRKGRPAPVAAKAPEAAPAPAPRPEPVAAPPEPPARPEAKPIAAKAEEPKKPAATEIPKPAPEKKPQDKPEPKKAPKPAPKKPAAPEKTKEQILAEARAQALKDVRWKEHLAEKQREKEERERQKALDEALAGAEAEAALAEAREAVSDEEGPGAGGTDEEGVVMGLREIYAAQVKEAIRSNWRYPNLPVEQSLTAKVFLRVGPGGHITEYTLLAPSGRADFDESVLKAVEETELLPPPPGDISEIRLNFNLQDMR